MIATDGVASTIENQEIRDYWSQRLAGSARTCLHGDPNNWRETGQDRNGRMIITCKFCGRFIGLRAPGTQGAHL